VLPQYFEQFVEAIIADNSNDFMSIVTRDENIRKICPPDEEDNANLAVITYGMAELENYWKSLSIIVFKFEAVNCFKALMASGKFIAEIFDPFDVVECKNLELIRLLINSCNFDKSDFKTMILEEIRHKPTENRDIVPWLIMTCPESFSRANFIKFAMKALDYKNEVIFEYITSIINNLDDGER